MKLISYYLFLLVFIALLTGFLLQRGAQAMSMGQVLSVSVLLGLYVVGMSFLGEGKPTDERAVFHRYLANRYALLAGTVVLSLGVLVQLFTEQLDYWLLTGLIAINVVKVMSLVYSSHKN